MCSYVAEKDRSKFQEKCLPCDFVISHSRPTPVKPRFLSLLNFCNDTGLCKSANEEHARDLPIMNGIKEEIKMIGVMNVGSPDYHDSLVRLVSRLKKLKVLLSCI